jgi:hypothetical protein
MMHRCTFALRVWEEIASSGPLSLACRDQSRADKLSGCRSIIPASLLSVTLPRLLGLSGTGLNGKLMRFVTVADPHRVWHAVKDKDGKSHRIQNTARPRGNGIPNSSLMRYIRLKAPLSLRK